MVNFSIMVNFSDQLYSEIGRNSKIDYRQYSKSFGNKF